MTFVNINMETTINDYEERGNDAEPDFEDDDKWYETSDDSTVNVMVTYLIDSIS